VAAVDDAALALAAADGNEDALAAVWNRYATLVRGLLRRSLGPGADVEDLVQETFLQFVREVKNLRDPAALRSFLIGIAVRVARSALRRRRLRRWLLLTDTGALPEQPHEGADEDAREALTRLYALLDRLDEKSRLLFVLRYIEGLELTCAAEATGVSLATAKRHLAKVTARVHAMAAREPALVAYLDARETRAETAAEEDSDGC
jgi:RNA polymerase sigma-70 factor (ECF subfamily)